MTPDLEVPFGGDVAVRAKRDKEGVKRLLGKRPFLPGRVCHWITAIRLEG